MILDINSAFWLIPLRIKESENMAFVTQERHFQWTCLLQTSLANFQRILSNILRKYKFKDSTVNYTDNIHIFSKSFYEQIDHLTDLLEKIKKPRFQVKIYRMHICSRLSKISWSYTK